MPTYTTVGGQTIKNVKVGWQAAGTLNADSSNAILITHFFSGTSHAFGKYKADDKAAGYWDAIIGPGKTIDTDKYYVISSDTLVNLNAKAPNVVTTGPASIDPDTGKPYGLTFPIVTIKDFVNVQKALVESLGISKLQGRDGRVHGRVAGLRMGRELSRDGGARHSGDRPAAKTSATIGWLNMWAQPILLDPKWNGGDYYGKEPPRGLAAALKIVTLHANQWEWVQQEPAARSGRGGQGSGRAAFGNKFKIETWLDQTAAARAKVSDANHFLYLIKANPLFAADPSKIKAPALVLYAPTDLVFAQALVEETAKRIAAAGAAG